MKIGNLNITKGVLLAPLAGVSNRPFRVLAIRAGASITYTGMVSSEGIIRHQQRTWDMMKFQPDEQPIGIQLFGANPEVMKQAAQIISEEFHPDIIDINFGCPVRKVVNKNGGAAVLKDILLTEEIIKATVEGAGQIPVTIKIRTGWEDSNPVYLKVGEIAQNCGIKAITLHARSRSKGFSGKADWSAIEELKRAVEIPIIGNGDIFSPQDAKRMFDETACDAVMVGRAALGNPFIFRQIKHYLKTGELLETSSVKEKIDMAQLHAELMVEQYGEAKGAVMMRRYLGWYVKGFKGAAELRTLLFQVKSINDIKNIFNDYWNQLHAISRNNTGNSDKKIA
ncbi:MAG: tRNA dihydrouridine synthase DusB [FCB group bacterium]|nr:tRNA dihydrouridine synthase DusB [FCB group bacterium]